MDSVARDENRNLLHPNALTAEELTLGRQVIRYNIDLGIVGEYIVTKPLFIGPLGKKDGSSGNLYPRSISVIRLRHVDSNEELNHSAGDLGVAQYIEAECGVDGWNGANCVVDSDNRHLLREVVAERELIDDVVGSDEDYVTRYCIE